MLPSLRSRSAISGGASSSSSRSLLLPPPGNVRRLRYFDGGGRIWIRSLRGSPVRPPPPYPLTDGRTDGRSERPASEGLRRPGRSHAPAPRRPSPFLGPDATVDCGDDDEEDDGRARGRDGGYAKPSMPTPPRVSRGTRTGEGGGRAEGRAACCLRLAPAQASWLAPPRPASRAGGPGGNTTPPHPHPPILGRGGKAAGSGFRSSSTVCVSVCVYRETPPPPLHTHTRFPTDPLSVRSSSQPPPPPPAPGPGSIRSPFARSREAFLDSGLGLCFGGFWKTGSAPSSLFATSQEGKAGAMMIARPSRPFLLLPLKGTRCQFGPSLS